METGMNLVSGQTALGWLRGTEKIAQTMTLILNINISLVNVTYSKMLFFPRLLHSLPRADCSISTYMFARGLVHEFVQE